MLKQLVEHIIEYTKNWSLTETEWYYNVECCRKPSIANDKMITWKEFNIAIREEILFDLVYNNGRNLYYQMKNDLCNYGDNVTFQNESKELEKQVQKYISNFNLEREGEEDYEI